MNKAKLNYWVDLLIAVAFVASGISGLMFLLPASWAAVREDGLPRLLGMTLFGWSDVHTYSSLAMMAGVALHLALHARWIRQMTTCTFGAKGRAAARAKRCDSLEENAPALAHRTYTRRGFLRTAGWSIVAILGAGAAYAGTRHVAAPSASPQTSSDDVWPTPSVTTAHAGINSVERAADFPLASGSTTPMSASSSSGSAPLATEAAPSLTPTLAPTVAPTEAPESVSVRCPRGVVYDPYPGRCRLYVDRNGDGYCDYSEPTEG